MWCFTLICFFHSYQSLFITEVLFSWQTSQDWYQYWQCWANDSLNILTWQQLVELRIKFIMSYLMRSHLDPSPTPGARSPKSGLYWSYLALQTQLRIGEFHLETSLNPAVTLKHNSTISRCPHLSFNIASCLQLFHSPSKYSILSIHLKDYKLLVTCGVIFPNFLSCLF